MLIRPPDVLFVPAHVLPLIHPRRSVITVHDLGYLYFPQAHRPADRLYLDRSTRWNARRATAVLADSAATKADLVRAYGVNPAKVHVVYLGRDESLARVRDPAVLAEVRSRYSITGCYLLYVGTLQPRKNLGRVIEAFARLVSALQPFNGTSASLRRERGSTELAEVSGERSVEPLRACPERSEGAGFWGERHPQDWGPGGLQLVLAGKKGWLYDDLFAQVGRLGLAGRVLFPGYIADSDLPALLSGALAFVFPSLYEGFGLPVLEAGACGVPVITSNTSSLPEVAGDPSAGSEQAAALLVDPHNVDAIAEAMYRLVTDEALRADLTRRGLENVKRFSWEKCARETLAVLEEVGRQGNK
jgi:glycosyltransferase involved in cell wall biosynthesis